MPKALVVDYAHLYFPESDILGGTGPSPFPSQWGMNSFRHAFVHFRLTKINQDVFTKTFPSGVEKSVVQEG